MAVEGADAVSGRPTPLEVSRDPAPFLREVRARIQARYGHVSGAQRLREATRDAWVLAEALAFAADVVADAEAGYLPPPPGAPAFPKPVRHEKPRGRGLRSTGLSGRSAASDNPAYLDAVAGLRYCCAGRYFGREAECSGRIDPHHAGRRPGMALKAPDDTAIPLCRWHHRALERLFGPFHGWVAEQLWAWREERIAETRAVVLPLLGAA